MNDCCQDKCSCAPKPRNKRALFLSYITVCYNVVEGIVAIAFSLTAGSIALLGFGFDSFIESLSGSVMIWRFTTKIPESQEHNIEKKAARLVSYTFFVLAAYITYQAVADLAFGKMPEESLPGIILALVSIITMPILFLLKRKTASKIGSRSLLADAKQTLACFFLSIALLAGLSLNYLFGFWWADPVASLVIVAFLLREGYQTYKHEELCEC